MKTKKTKSKIKIFYLPLFNKNQKTKITNIQQS